MFPQTEYPASKLKYRGILAKIILLENKEFNKEILKLEYHQMKNQGYEKCLCAIKVQKLCLQKTTVGNGVPVADVVSLNQNTVDVAVKTIAADIEIVFEPKVSATRAPTPEKQGSIMESDSSEDEE